MTRSHVHDATPAPRDADEPRDRLAAVEDAYDTATGSWTGWEWPHDPAGIVTEGPGAQDDWDAWEAARATELRRTSDHETHERTQGEYQYLAQERDDLDDEDDGWCAERRAEIDEQMRTFPLYALPYTAERAREIAIAEREYGEEAQRAAASAESAGLGAREAARERDPKKALEYAQQASSYESDYGDDPTWRPLVRAIEATLARIDAPLRCPERNAPLTTDTPESEDD